MAKGRKTGGRQKGTPNRSNAQREAEVQASGLTPLEYMLGVLRSDKPPLPEGMSPNSAEAIGLLLNWESKRMWAAEKAAPYVHPKLAQVEAETKAKVDAKMTVTWLPPQS